MTLTKPCLRVTQIQPTKKMDGQAQPRQQQSQQPNNRPDPKPQNKPSMDFDGVPF